jgi:hypothetical protein
MNAKSKNHDSLSVLTTTSAKISKSVSFIRFFRMKWLLPMAGFGW